MNLTQGEIADRITILELKNKAGLPTPELDDFRMAYRGPESSLEPLREINQQAWDVVERLNTFLYDLGPWDSDEVLKDFKTCHVLNRKRVDLKNAINDGFGQAVEHKTWHRL